MNFKPLLFLLASLVMTSGCYVDDQRLNPKEYDSAVNPKPTFANPETNKNHKIIIAILDDGIDYNHPALKDNIHYKFNEKGEPISAGYDYLGEDQWPAPYIGRTAHLTDQSKKEDREKAQLMEKGVKYFLGLYPEYEYILNWRRAIEDEHRVMIGHGTHVAGLAAYDNPEIGLLGYRILPYNEEWKAKHKELHIYDLLEKAIDQAVADGAKIINLSIGQSYEKTDEDYEEGKKKVEILQKIIQKHSDIIFVAAAGNENSWLDGKVRLNMPCGIMNAKNLLCVGALDDEYDLAEFTNIPMQDVPLLFVWGTNIVSTMPTKRCPILATSEFELFALSDDEFKLKKPEHTKKSYAKSTAQFLHDSCKKYRFDYGYMSGTSMATPLAAKLTGELWIKNPSLKADKLLELLISKADPHNLGRLSISKLKVKKPSWYKDQEIMKNIINPEAPPEEEASVAPASIGKRNVWGLPQADDDYFYFFKPPQKEKK